MKVSPTSLRAHARSDEGRKQLRTRTVVEPGREQGGEVGRRVLICACTALPFENPQQPGGYVVVFDDVTNG